MVSDSEVAEQLREVLRTADLTTTTPANLRRRLEEHFGVELSNKKAFIREQVDLFLQEVQVGNDGDVGEGEEKEELNGGEGEEEEDEEEEEEDEEEEDEGTSSNGKGSGKKGSSKKKNAKRTGGGFTKLCSLSPQLQKFIGESELARTQVVKRMWAYIRKNSLQDPKNKRKIICDDKLHEIFNVKTIDMFQMNKVLSKHIWPLDSENAPPAKSKEKIKHPKIEREEEEEDESPKKEKRRKTGGNAFLTPLTLSDALVKFIGTGESALSRGDVVKRMWDYIKQNNLQDPSDKRRIICDEKLKELLEVDSFTGFTVPKLLAPHFVKSE